MAWNRQWNNRVDLSIVFMRAQYRKSRFNQITYKSACNKRHGKLRNLMSIDAVFHG